MSLNRGLVGMSDRGSGGDEEDEEDEKVEEDEEDKFSIFALKFISFLIYDFWPNNSAGMSYFKRTTYEAYQQVL